MKSWFRTEIAEWAKAQIAKDVQGLKRVRADAALLFVVLLAVLVLGPGVPV